MSAFEAYKEYVALKNHFTKPEYDFVKYNGKTGLKVSSFDKRKDKIFFEKLAKIENYHEFLIANFIVNPKLWIRDLSYSEDAKLIYQDWKKRNQSITYLYKKEFRKILEDKGGQQHPAAIRLYLGGEISLESLCIFVAMTNAIKTWNDKLEYDPVWEDLKLKIIKYTPFIKYEKSKIKQIMLDVMSDLEYTK